MLKYTEEELRAALRAIGSIIEKCEKAQQKFEKGSSQYSLLENRLKAMYISKAFIEEKLTHINKISAKIVSADNNNNSNILLSNLDKVHTTELGAQRIIINLRLTTDDVVGWCKEKIADPKSDIKREGKNWYVINDGNEITVNAYSYTIITAHEIK